MWGLYSHSRKYRKICLRIIFEICIRTFTNVYLPLRPLPLYGYNGCIHTPLMPIHKNIIWELISEQIHAAHVYAPQANTGKYSWQIICVLGLCQGIVCLSSKAPQKKNRPKEGRRSLCNFTPAISDYTPAVSDYTPAISDYTPITLTLFNFFGFNYEKLHLHLHLSIFLN